MRKPNRVPWRREYVTEIVKWTTKRRNLGQERVIPAVVKDFHVVAERARSDQAVG